MDLSEVRATYLFEGLPREQVDDLLTRAAPVVFEPGQVLFAEGQPATSWWVLVAGEVDLVRQLGREQAVVTRMATPGRWAGGFRAWDEHGVYLATGRAATSGRAMEVPAEVLRAWTQRWFPPAVHLLEGLFGTARSVEATARERAALVTLGTLSAGLAHELGNPAAAAVRAVQALEEVSGTLVTAVRRLADVAPGQLAVVDALREQLPDVPPPLSPLARADREDELADWLADHDVAHGDVLAAVLAAAGVDLAWCERVAATVQPQALGPGLEWVAAALQTRALLEEVRTSTTRISTLVGAVSTYSQMDRAARQRTDVHDGLESTLLMLGHLLRPGVDVQREYADVPALDAYPAELNQVWTNLVTNAVEAMDGAGQLRLTTRSEDAHVVVEVVDTGRGMPPEVLARAFDPFFTTKDVGRGPGLGLDVARRIVVERHGGDLTLQSRPGRTVATVRLPVGPR